MRILKISTLSIFILLIFTLFGCKISFAYTSPYTEPNFLVKYGSQGDSVKWVQDMLKQNGYSISVDGFFGNKTKYAVSHFQRYNNLSPDGIVGSLTRNALKKSISYSTSNVTNNNNFSNTTNSSNNANSVNTNTFNNITTTINSNMYTTANVNFRNGPSTNNSSYGILSKGTVVYALQSKSNGWTYVKYSNKYGYICSNYLSKTYISATNTTTSNNLNGENNTSISGLPNFYRGNTKLIDIIKSCKLYYSNNNFEYSLAPGVRYIPADKSISHNSKYYTDCSNFVSWVLYEYALANGNLEMKNYFSYQRNSSTFTSIGANGGNNYLTVINNLDSAKAGDIIVTAGHVEFLSSYTRNSNGTLSLKVYNCGSNTSIKQAGISNSATKYESEIKCILRVK